MVRSKWREAFVARNTTYIHFHKQIGYKGVSNKIIENLKYKHFAELYEAKLRTEYRDVGKKEKIIHSAKSVKKQTSKQSFDDIIGSLTVQNYLIDTSLFTKAKVGGFITSLGLNAMDNFITNINTDKYKELKEYLLNKTNYFIKDLTNFIITQYSQK